MSAVMGRGDYWDSLLARQQRENHKREIFIERESALRPVDVTWVIDGLRNLSELEERQMAAALVSGDQLEAGRLLHVATQRWIAERIQDDADELA